MQIQEADFGAEVGRYGKVLYLCHRNADPDALGSGFALQEAFGGDLGVVEGVSRTASSLVDAIGAWPMVDPSPEGYDLVVVVDTAVRLQIDDPDLRKYAVIDHHQDRDLIEGAAFHIQKSVDSTAEIVWRILVENGIEPSQKAVLGLMVGIITDTGRFRHAHSGSFRTVAEILERSDVEYSHALGVLSRVPADISRRIAAFRAANRAEIEWTDDWIVATSQVRAFEGSAAMTLLDIGADVAFVGGKHGEVSRVSGRARRAATFAGVDLAEITREVGKAHDGDGGGHRGAAALEAKGAPKVLLEECKGRVMEVLGQES